MKKKIKDLTANDFPGIDPVKFKEWKREKRNANSNTTMFFIIFFLINVLIFLALGYLWFGGVLLFLILFFINKKSNKLSRELGIEQRMLRQALKGEKVDYVKPKIKPSEKNIEKSKPIEKNIEKPEVEYEYECSECKAEVKEEDEICPSCGAEL